MFWVARVLIVEDERTIAHVLNETLTDEGHEVLVEYNGAAGLALLQRIPAPDIALVDLLMPELTGRALVEAMREDSRLAGIPVVLITGAVRGTDAFPAAGSYHTVIRKPFDVLEVIKVVEELAPNRP
jgi:CheY-like chemotaxis protein